MSVVLITQHDENIYNIVKPTQPRELKKVKAHDKRIGEKSKAIQRHRKPCMKKVGVMGIPAVDPPDPKLFLKKQTGKPAYPLCIPEKDPKPPKKPSDKDKIPTVAELRKQPVPQKAEKNFIVTNIKTASKMKAKEPQHKVVIERTGKSIPVEYLEPIYIKLSKFGRTPKYLQRFNEEREKEYQMKKDASGQMAQPLCKYITRDQREHLLEGLKQNWEELQQKYQGLPILTDTIPKILHKSKIEKQLRQLEKDIVLIERHPYIYVYNDNELP